MLFLLGYIGTIPSMNDDMAFLEEYTLLDEIGQGGFATVYKVRHNELGYIRALRVMNAVIARGTEDKTYQRFIDECRLLMRIGNGNHPNIIHISRAILKDQRAAVEMDFVDGHSLSKYVSKCGGFVPVEEVMTLLEQMSSALAYCHEDIYRFCMDRVEDDLHDDPEDGSKVLVDDQTRERLIQKYRVIHNDIHSDNIIRREDGNYILLDFGLAIQGENVVRSSRRSDGAPEFKAPEKWDGDTELTTQSDIYGLGVVLYECLAGRVPFPLSSEEAGSVKALYLLGESHKSQIPDSIYELRKAAYEKANPGQTYDAPDYPQWLEEVIMKCLEKKPQDRFLNGKELYAYVKEKKAEDKEKASVSVPVIEPVPVQDPAQEPITPMVAPVEPAAPAAPIKVVSSKGLKAWRAAAILSGFLAVAMAAFCFDMLFVSDPADEPAVEEEQKVIQPLDIDHPAVVYFESNVSLSRSDMEDIPELRGLWDAINTYDFVKYASYFTILQNSNSYMNILMRLRDKKESLGYLNETGETFVPEGEDEIQMLSYLFRLLRY